MPDLSPLQKEYRDYFIEMMEKHGLDGLSGIDEEKVKAFFKEVSDGWEIGEGRKKASAASSPATNILRHASAELLRIASELAKLGPQKG